MAVTVDLKPDIKIEEADKKNVEEAIEELKKVKDGEDKDEIEAKTKELSEKISKVGEKMYSQTGGQQEQPTDGENTSEEGKNDEKKVGDDKKEAEEGQVVD